MPLEIYLKIKNTDKVDYKKLMIQCSCGSTDFMIVKDASMTDSTAKWIMCTCGKKYDVRINLITQKYIEEIESC